MISDLYIQSLPDQVNVADFIRKIELSWTMDAVSELALTIHDPDMSMFQKNYFQVQREVTYGGTTFEIASLQVGQGPGSAAEIVLECRTAAIQRMKRDKSPQQYGGASPTEFAAIVADKFGLKFLGEGTAKAKVMANTTKDSEPESVWAMLTRLAGDAKFVCFEAGGTLFFASEAWLLQKYGNVTIEYPTPYLSPYTVLEIPTCRRSDDDVFAAEFTATLAATNSVDLRAGMTVLLKGMHDFDWLYLLSEVSYEDGEGKPVSIAARTAEKTE